MNIISLGPYLSSKTRVKKKYKSTFWVEILSLCVIHSVYWELFFQLRWKPRLGIIWILKTTFPKDLGKITVFTTQEILLVIQLVSWTYTVGPCIVRPKYPKKGVHYAKPHYVKPHYTSAWIV